MDEPKVVLVTGSSSGIGVSTALLFARRGYKVVVTDSDKNRVESVARQCTEQSPNGYKAFSIVADLSDTYNGEIIVRQTVDHFGRLDVLVNNVGAFYKTRAADKSSLSYFKKTMAINVESVVHTTMESIPHLEATRGNIIFVSIMNPDIPTANDYAYRMSKVALISYAKSLAVDVAPKIRVNIVSVDQIIPPHVNNADKMDVVGLKNRHEENDDISNAIHYLASDEASFVNGLELLIGDGDVDNYATRED